MIKKEVKEKPRRHGDHREAQRRNEWSIGLMEK
jgi:hypothetical protein